MNARQVGATALVRFRCIVDSVVRFLQRSERSVQRLWFVSTALWIQLCVFCNAVNARQVGATAWFVSTALWIQLRVFCNAVNARQVGATALVRFRCIVDSVVRFFATQ